jgi:hypothetical protein
MPYTSREAIEMRKNSKCVRVYLRRKKKCERAKIEFFVCLSTLIKYKKFSSSFFFIHKYPLSLSNKFKYCRWVKYKNQQIRSLSYIYIYTFFAIERLYPPSASNTYSLVLLLPL